MNCADGGGSGLASGGDIGGGTCAGGGSGAGGALWVGAAEAVGWTGGDGGAYGCAKGPGAAGVFQTSMLGAGIGAIGEGSTAGGGDAGMDSTGG
jgi:hypothetical protein